MTDLSVIPKIWSTIVESNIFNFVIFIWLFALIFKKIKLKEIIHSLQKKIVEILNNAKKTGEEAQNELLNAQKSVENLESELEIIFEDAKKSAEVIGDKILSEAQKQIENIEANAVKVINAEEKLITSNLTKSTSKISVEMAKTHIKNTLQQTPSLYEKYINESIDDLDRLSF
jgi:F0F1-type ATP synthase membrane subunit b/b'